jgi:hypothetical protein
MRIMNVKNFMKLRVRNVMLLSIWSPFLDYSNSE